MPLLPAPEILIDRELPLTNSYLRWRAQRLNRLRFAEKTSQSPPESLLQQVWLYQRLVQEKLQTIDGRPVRVLHPGFWNREPGPDFQKAVVQVGSDFPVSGDIEIDIVPSGWEQHSHASNPNYRNVVLHVTWEPATTQKERPSLPLKYALDSTLPELSFWLGVEPRPAPGGLAGKCSAPFSSLPPARVQEILRQAAQARLRQKAEWFQALARQRGWENAFWEGLFSALGYKRNVWPMRRLAQINPFLITHLPPKDPVLTLQARLLGTACLLPPELKGHSYLRQLWQYWWRESAACLEYILPAGLWTLGGIRPANHPQRRLALAAHWLANGTLLYPAERWLERRIESPDLLRSLEEILQVKHDEFWSYHWMLRSAPSVQPLALLGIQRVTDIAMNVVLPWLYVRACAGGNERLAAVAENRYLHWPPGEDNSVLRLARQRLFGGASSSFLTTASQQQGVLQIVRDFCDHSNAACHNCEFPDLIKATVSCE